MRAIAEKFVINNIIIDELIIKHKTSIIWDPGTPTEQTCRIWIDKFGEYLEEIIAKLCVIKTWNDLYIKLNPKVGFNLCECTNNLGLLEYGPEKLRMSYQFRRVDTFDYVENKEITGGCLDAPYQDEYMNRRFIDNGYIYSMEKLNKDFLEI